ncbi:PAS domain S-box protein [Geomonas sp. RF6]|uniref:PAS domain-containing hybrid sensor histidine kinase/response regulator n=1 Tax=Geomonas sp. RF6 TaxID=2897342 RepID=UPI001E5D4932|nr:PAS domain S-box protein [Geomonas sp. RF6]UFS70079.1 PAS domain S-box protein [Geomonas sp. RF6]
MQHGNYLIRDEGVHPDELQADLQRMEERIRELERSEAGLLQAKRELETAVSLLESAIIATDSDGVITRFNSGAEHLLGYSAQEVVGSRCDDTLLVREEVERWRRLLDLPSAACGLEVAFTQSAAVAEGEAYWTLQQKGGVKLLLRLALREVKGSDGRAEGFVAVVQQAECKRCEGRAKLTTFAEAIPHPLFVKDQEGKFILCNSAFAKFLGRAKEDLSGADPAQFFPEEYCRQDANTDLQLQHLGSASFQARARRADQAMRVLSVKKCRVPWGDPSSLAVVGAVLDITEEIAIQEELQLQATMLEEEIANHQRAEEALRERERMLSLIINTVPQAIFWKDTRSVYLGCNQKFADYAGLPSPADIVGKTDFELPLETAVAERYRQGDRDVMVRDMPRIHGEESLLRRDGREVVIDTTKIPLHDANACVVGLLGVFEDITERKQVEQELRESEERLRLIFDASQVGIILLSTEGRIIFGNKRLAEMFGCSLDKMMGTLYIDWLYPAGAEEGIRATDDMITGRMRCVTAERRYRRKDGSDFFGFISGRRMVEPDGSLRALVGCIADVTELKSSRHELEREKERLAVTLRSIGDGVITVDNSERVVLLSRVAEELCGYLQVEAAGLPLSEVFRVVHEESGEPLAESPAAQVLRTRRPVEHTEHTVLVARDGTRRTIATSVAPILDRERQILGVVLVFRDVTEKKAIEEELFKARKLESLGILAGGIAHDFNNLLTGIMGNISLARMQMSQDELAAPYLERAQQASERSRELTQQLLTFSKGGTPVKKLTCLAQIIRDSATFALTGSNVRCTFDISSDLWPAEIDPVQMGQVISNLVINADQAMPGGGLLVIRAENVLPLDAETTEKKIRITLKDTGVGISGEHRQRIFDPYFTTKRSGSGLGLATVYSIIKKHDGELKVYSRENHGTTFAITLPAQEGVVPKVVQQPQVEPQTFGKVLVMDDDAAIRGLAKDSLDFLGYRTTVCKDGRELLELYRSAQAEGAPYCAVIMDLTVPGGMGGREAVQRLLEIDPTALAVASSGYSEDAIMANHRHFGFAGVIAKPYSIQDLKSSLAVLLKERQR